MSRLGQIKQTFKSVRIEIKAFLRRQQWKEALIFFCFILLAFGFCYSNYKKAESLSRTGLSKIFSSLPD